MTPEEAVQFVLDMMGGNHKPGDPAMNPTVLIQFSDLFLLAKVSGDHALKADRLRRVRERMQDAIETNDAIPARKLEFHGEEGAGDHVNDGDNNEDLKPEMQAVGMIIEALNAYGTRLPKWQQESNAGHMPGDTAMYWGRLMEMTLRKGAVRPLSGLLSAAQMRPVYLEMLAISLGALGCGESNNVKGKPTESA